MNNSQLEYIPSLYDHPNSPTYQRRWHINDANNDTEHLLATKWLTCTTPSHNLRM